MTKNYMTLEQDDTVVHRLWTAMTKEVLDPAGAIISI